MARGGYGLLRLLPFVDSGALAAPARGRSSASRMERRCSPSRRAPGSRRFTVPSSRSWGVCGAAISARCSSGSRRRARALLLDGLEGLIPGRVRGPLSGGNLEVFSRLVGTPYLPDVSGAILFFEDLGERPYRIDRLLTHLDLAGVFGAASGVIAGDFSGCREPEATRADSPTAEEVLVDRLGRLPDPGRAGRRVRPRDAQPRAPVRHALRARHRGGHADRPRRRGQLALAERSDVWHAAS